MVILLSHVVDAAIAGPLVLKIREVAFLPVIRIELLITGIREHVGAGMLLVDDDFRTLFHSLGYDLKEALQVIEPAERADSY